MLKSSQPFCLSPLLSRIKTTELGTYKRKSPTEYPIRSAACFIEHNNPSQPNQLKLANQKKKLNQLKISLTVVPEVSNETKYQSYHHAVRSNYFLGLEPNKDGFRNVVIAYEAYTLKQLVICYQQMGKI